MRVSLQAVSQCRRSSLGATFLNSISPHPHCSMTAAHHDGASPHHQQRRWWFDTLVVVTWKKGGGGHNLKFSSPLFFFRAFKRKTRGEACRVTEQGNLCEGGTDDHASPATLVLPAIN